jgi:hypothetical protein
MLTLRIRNRLVNVARQYIFDDEPNQRKHREIRREQLTAARLWSSESASNITQAPAQEQSRSTSRLQGAT